MYPENIKTIIEKINDHEYDKRFDLLPFIYDCMIVSKTSASKEDVMATMDHFLKEQIVHKGVDIHRICLEQTVPFSKCIKIILGGNLSCVEIRNAAIDASMGLSKHANILLDMGVINEEECEALLSLSRNVYENWN